MRRWNGWGDDSISYPLAKSAAEFLVEKVGTSQIIPDATLESVLAKVSPSRIPPHPLVLTEPIDRLRHACGQSLPDWIALRSNTVKAFPDGVAYPRNDLDVQDLLHYCSQVGNLIIPYGGGTSVVGHINPTQSEQPTLSVDLSRMSRLIDLDETSRLATFEAGINGPQIEELLNTRGFTLGHFPQSFELSTLGGWIATRSSGQQSYYYGRIEDIFAGGHIETPIGGLDLPPLPASAAGPDLRQIILGNEGRLGIITRAIVRLRPIPETDKFYGIFFPHWEAGVEAVRQIAQSRVAISMARLSNADETNANLILSGKERLVAWAKRGLNSLGYRDQRCLMIIGVTGDRKSSRLAKQQALSICRSRGGLAAGAFIGNIWKKSRFLTPYLRNTLWERGYAIDTLETAVPWSKIISCSQAIIDALQNGSNPNDQRVLVLAHLSHIYRDGASIYVTIIFKRSRDSCETFEHWNILKQAASLAIVTHGGTISHQHGVGEDHAPYLEKEKGKSGMEILRSIGKTLDPDGLMNPGKLWLNSKY